MKHSGETQAPKLAAKQTRKLCKLVVNLCNLNNLSLQLFNNQCKLCLLNNQCNLKQLNNQCKLCLQLSNHQRGVLGREKWMRLKHMGVNTLSTNLRNIGYAYVLCYLFYFFNFKAHMLLKTPYFVLIWLQNTYVASTSFILS